MLRLTTTILALILTFSHAFADELDKITIAGWSKPISEITNILAEPECEIHHKSARCERWRRATTAILLGIAFQDLVFTEKG